MKYIVTEIQTAQDGSVATLTNSFDDRNTAESSYHTILAAAAISQLPMHAAMLYTNDGYVIMCANYIHAPESTPEPDVE